MDIADTVNGLIIIPNLIALIILSKEIVAMKKEYIDKDLAVYKKDKKSISQNIRKTKSLWIFPKAFKNL